DRHVYMGLLGLLDAYNEKSRRFLKYFLPFMLTGIVYDSMRYYYWWGIAGHIHVAEPYNFEKAIFGFHDAGKLVTPNEYFQVHTSSILDFFCGLAYLIFVGWYLTAAFMLYLSDNLRILRTFGWCFFTVNCMGFSTYYIYPAAPPWYVIQYGLLEEAKMYIHATPSAASRFDLLFGTHLFDTMYGNSVDVYGAFPSLHVAYPLLVAWVAIVTKRFRVPAIAFYFLMCFSAIYLQHHYIIDIILGTGYSFAGLLIVRCVQERKTLAHMSWSERLGKLLWPTPTLSPEISGS
ncbi:MAG: inositol phosphorylceramide synthase, partial [Deltaproteobacteria bacterium]|nr:inositol phosphorylceramide synthase [Deltaproteobacteria bacterium]